MKFDYQFYTYCYTKRKIIGKWIKLCCIVVCLFLQCTGNAQVFLKNDTLGKVITSNDSSLLKYFTGTVARRGYNEIKFDTTPVMMLITVADNARAISMQGFMVVKYQQLHWETYFLWNNKTMIRPPARVWQYQILNKVEKDSISVVPNDPGFGIMEHF